MFQGRYPRVVPIYSASFILFLFIFFNLGKNIVTRFIFFSLKLLVKFDQSTHPNLPPQKHSIFSDVCSSGMFYAIYHTTGHLGMQHFTESTGNGLGNDLECSLSGNC